MTWQAVGCWLVGMMLFTALAGDLLFTKEVTPVPSLGELIQQGLTALAARYPVLQSNQQVARAASANVQSIRQLLDDAQAKKDAIDAEVSADVLEINDLRQSVKDAIDALFSTGGLPGDGAALRDALAAAGPVPLIPLQTIDAKLDSILAGITTLGVTMSAELDRLNAAVAAQTTVEGSIETLVNGLAQQIRDLAAANANGVTPAQLNDLAGQIEANNAKAQAVVVANTQAPPPPAPLPPAGKKP